MSGLVDPQTLRGFRDILPTEMIVRNRVIDRVRQVYESYGFLPLDTPTLELLPTLVGSGGEETDKLIFSLSSPEKQSIGMRFDLTVPFARIIAQYAPHTIKLPFKRYHIGPVFRADDPKPDQGRFRQFTQFDIDIAGTESVAADAEIVAVMSDALTALGLRSDGEGQARYFIRINDRRLVDAFLSGLGISEESRVRHVLRVVDKRDKLTDSDLVSELGEGRYDASGDHIRGVGLSKTDIDRIMHFVNISASTRRAALEQIGAAIAPSEGRDYALSQGQELLDHLDALGVPETAALLDASLARGLEYYTGPVFEGTLPGAGVGSIIGGGRYDGLVSRFMDEPVPATGASIGLDRLVTGLSNLGLMDTATQNTAQILVLTMPGVPEFEASRLAAELRRNGLATELYLGQEMGKVGRQLAYANAREFLAAVILGKDEVANDTVSVKDLGAGIRARSAIADREAFLAESTAGQQTLPRSEVAEYLRQLVSASAG